VSTRRLEAFTDGVFAIAATLLVLDIRVDDLGAINSENEMWAGIASLGPAIVNLGVSFLLLGLLWTIHVRQFEYIVRVDGTLLWLNILRLLVVVLVPFSTSLNDDYGEFLAGRMLLPLNFFVLVVIGAVQWAYATRPGRRLVAGLSADAIRTSRVNAFTAVVIGAAVLALSSLVGSIAFLLFALDPLVSVVLRRAGVISPVNRTGGPAEAEPPGSTVSAGS
jgi:uncharacterized membrane protein